jgi:hypothetical protein
MIYFWAILVLSYIVICLLGGIWYWYSEAKLESLKAVYTDNKRQKAKFGPIKIWIDAAFAGNDRIEIERAISNWNICLNGNMELRIIGGQQPTTKVIGL